MTAADTAGSEHPSAFLASTGSRPFRASPAELRSLHDRFISDPRATDLSSLRPVIARSWLRSVASNISPGLRIFDQIREPRLDEQVLRCAEPVLTELERLSADTGAGICLADPFGTLAVFRGDADVLRWAARQFPMYGSAMAEDLVGTNSDGTVVEEGVGVQVWGAEHFAEGLQHICCTSVPIRDPLRRSMRAILSLVLPERVGLQTDPRSVALLVEGAASEVTRLLENRLAAREQALLTAYLCEVRKRGSDAVVVMDERTTIASKGALQVLEQTDYAVLAGYAREAERGSRSVEHQVTVGDGRVLALQARPIVTGGETIGSVLRLRAPKPAASGGMNGSGRARTSLFPMIVGTSIAIRRALEVATAVARRRMPGHVVGDAGTGKLLLARAIAGFMAPAVDVVDCRDAELDAEALTRAAHRTLTSDAALVLSHVDALGPDVLEGLAEIFAEQDTPRVVATLSHVGAATVDLIAALRSVEISLPPLRSRREDIPLLVAYFLQQEQCGVERVSSSMLSALSGADWPGNVRQLKEVVVAAAARCGTVELALEHVTESQRRKLGRSRLSRLEEAELQQIREALAEARGNRVRAAELLEIGRSTLYRKLDMYTRRGFPVES